MNKRIRELEQQATEIVKCGLNGTSSAEVFNRKKFAKLIIQECMSVADLPNDASGQWDHLLPSQVIKEHFGVEE